MHVIASAEVLRETPLPHAVASYPLKEAAAAIRSGGVSLPHGAGRFVVSVDGTESKEDITALKVSRSCCSARQHSVAAAFAYKQVMCRLHGNEVSLRRFPQSSLHAVCVQLTSANSEALSSSSRTWQRSSILHMPKICGVAGVSRSDGALALRGAATALRQNNVPQPCVRAAVQGSEAVMALLSTADGVSRVHASRRFFDLLQEHDIDIPVIHQRVFTAGTIAQLAQCPVPPIIQMTLLPVEEGYAKQQQSGQSCHTHASSTLRLLPCDNTGTDSGFICAGASRDEQILTSGTEIGALLVDGLGDGVLIECPGEDLETLRLMSFGLLQVRRTLSASVPRLS